MLATAFVLSRGRSPAGHAAVRLAGIVAASVLAAGCRLPHAVPASELQPSLVAFEARLPVVEAQVPAISAAATVAAGRILENPGALLNVPWDDQEAFSEEMINRAGGLAHAYPTEVPYRERQATSNDVVLFAVRSWEEAGTGIVQRIRSFRDRGWHVTLIASSRGRPDGVVADAFIENGAPSGVSEHGRINIMVNAAIGWMWCCEYVAAMTRLGKIPGILISVAFDHGKVHNKPIQTPEGRHWMGDVDRAVPSGRLARLYFKRLKKLVADQKTLHIQEQLNAAADVVADRFRSGRAVGLSGVGHLILHETREDDFKCDWVRFRGRVFKRHLAPGGLLVWIAYMGMNSAYRDYGAAIRDAGLDLVTSYAPPPKNYRYTGDTGQPLAHIDQCWKIGDAEVPVPGTPGRMAPVSGINRVLVLRMLDDAVAERLAGDEPTPPVGHPSGEGN